MYNVTSAITYYAKLMKQGYKLLFKQNTKKCKEGNNWILHFVVVQSST